MASEVMVLSLLQRWYEAQCNGDWEHSYGVCIDTIDNPGWVGKVDLAETQWEDLEIERTIIGNDEVSWYQYEVIEHGFIGAGGTPNLVDILNCFLKIVGVLSGPLPNDPRAPSE